MPKYKSGLSVSGINDMIKKVRDYQNSLEYKVNLLAESLASLGVEYAIQFVDDYDAVFTSELIQSIHKERKGSKKIGAIFVVRASSGHAAFVEFGTGQRGEESPYPYPLPSEISWDYNVGKTIFEISPGEYGWFYPRDGKWYFTQGMPSRPFMYETSLELQKQIVKIAKQVFHYKG